MTASARAQWLPALIAEGTHPRQRVNRAQRETMMEFLVQFELDIPDGAAESEVEDRQRAEAAAAESLADEGHLVRLWHAPIGTDHTTVLGLYRADSKAELDGLLSALPLHEWMHTSITPLVRHPNDPTRIRAIDRNDSAATRCTTTPNET